MFTDVSFDLLINDGPFDHGLIERLKSNFTELRSKVF